MTDSTLAERQNRFRDARRKAGLKRIEEYVPADRADEIRAIAAQMRETAQQKETQA